MLHSQLLLFQFIYSSSTKACVYEIKLEDYCYGLDRFPDCRWYSVCVGLPVGYRIAAAPMEELRVSIEPGMGHADVQTLMAKYADMADPDSRTAIIQVSQQSRNITSPIVGSWFCFAKVHMGENGVESIGETNCVD